MLPPIPGLRRLRNQIARRLPPSLKARLHSRLYGFRRPGVDLPVEFSTDERGPIVRLDGRLTLVTSDDERRELAYHLVENGGSIEETRGFLDLAASAAMLFDVGAAKAFYARLFCLNAPGARAVAFEPSPAQLASAARLVALNGCADRVILRGCALADRVSRQVGALHSNDFIGIGGRGGTPVEVDVSTIDAEVESLGLVPDLLKIDVEGSEYDVIVGARRLLAARKPPICLELHLGALEQRGVAPRRVIEELQSHGYRFRSWVGDELNPRGIWESIHGILRLLAY